MSKQPAHTLLLVTWLPGFAQGVCTALPELGQHVHIVPQRGLHTVLRGLASTNNDACYSSVYAVGQVMDAVLSGRYELENAEVLVPASCVDCRAGDIAGLVRKALQDAGLSHIKVRLLAEYLAQSEEQLAREVAGVSPVRLDLLGGAPLDATLSVKAVKRAAEALLLADLQEQLRACVRPYASSTAVRYLEEQCALVVSSAGEGSFDTAVQVLLEVAASCMPSHGEQKAQVALVGTAPVLFNTTINGETVLLIEAEGCEASFPWYSSFVLYGLAAKGIAQDLQAALQSGRRSIELAIRAHRAHATNLLLPALPSLCAPKPLEFYRQLALGSALVSEYEISGAGWLLVGQVLDALERGVRHVVYAHSFGCLPAHTVGRGMFRELRARYPDLSIVSLEYDPGASAVNQSNRLKLLTSQAKNAKHHSKKGA